MFTYDLPAFRVCYADTDRMGYMYYGNYTRYYEIGRVEALRSLGFHYKDLEESGVIMPVYELKMRYMRPARYDDLLTVRVTIPELPGVRMTFQYQMINQLGEVLNTAETTLVFQRLSTGRLCSVPTDVLERLRPYYERTNVVEAVAHHRVAA